MRLHVGWRLVKAPVYRPTQLTTSKLEVYLTLRDTMAVVGIWGHNIRKAIMITTESPTLHAHPTATRIEVRLGIRRGRIVHQLQSEQEPSILGSCPSKVLGGLGLVVSGVVVSSVATARITVGGTCGPPST